MKEKHLFEYAVIRVVPRVEREEFMNVGVILYCPAERFLDLKFNVDEGRLRALCEVFDLCDLLPRLQAFQKVCNGSKEGGAIAALPIASRFRWLIAARSTVVQTSKVHPGMCSDARETLDTLFNQLVL